MFVQDVLDLAKVRLNNVAISRDTSAMIKFIYLGISELYRIFNLSLKVEVIETNPNLSLYELRNPDVSLLLNVFDIHGRDLKQTDVVDGHHWDMKIINYRSFILNNPINGFLYAVYKASPPVITDTHDELDIPDAMIDALLCYVTYMAYSTVISNTTILGRNSASTEASQYYQSFKVLCQELEMQGYKIPLNAEMLSVLIKGYV